MKLEKQNSAGNWPVQIETGNFNVISRANDKVVVELRTWSSHGSPQTFRLHLSQNELKILAGEDEVQIA
jgi:hypothetical protein